MIPADHRLVTFLFLKWLIMQLSSRQLDWYSLMRNICPVFLTDVRQVIDSCSNFRLAIRNAS